MDNTFDDYVVERNYLSLKINSIVIIRRLEH